MGNHATGVTVTCDVTKGGCELVTEEVDHKDAYAFEKTVQTEKHVVVGWLGIQNKIMQFPIQLEPNYLSLFVQL